MRRCRSHDDRVAAALGTQAPLHYCAEGHGGMIGALLPCCSRLPQTGLSPVTARGRKYPSASAEIDIRTGRRSNVRRPNYSCLPSDDTRMTGVADDATHPRAWWAEQISECPVRTPREVPFTATEVQHQANLPTSALLPSSQAASSANTRKPVSRRNSTGTAVLSASTALP
jgi:hypothetical protein